VDSETARLRPTQARATWVVAIVSLLLGLALFVTMLVNAAAWVRLGVVGHLWYLSVLLVGAAVGRGAFKLADSYADYSGQVLGGQLRMGGPAVLALVIVVLGFVLVPKPTQKLDVTVFVHGPAGPQDRLLSGRGRLSLDLGADRREEPIGPKGEVRFVGIPADQLGRTVSVGLVAVDDFELAQPQTGIKLDAEAVYVPVQSRQLVLRGWVMDAQNRAVAGAQWRLGVWSGRSADDGSFSVALPANLLESDRLLVVQAAGWGVWRGIVVPGGGPVTAQLPAP